MRAVACTPPSGEGNLCLTGADDGIARIWDLDNPEPAKAVRELKGRHQARIISVAFAPDGKTCVTADEKEICLWDVASGDMKYRFPPHHRGQITYVQYTPQSKLLSVARDHSLCLWKLGEKGATPDKSHRLPLRRRVRARRQPGRAERAVRPGAGPARPERGRRDVPADRRRAAGPVGRQPVRELRPVLPGRARRCWRPARRTTRCSCGKLPAPGVRGHLIRRLAVGPTSAPTCAAFAPDGSFAVTGTQDDKVMVWRIPPEAETKQELTGTLTFVSSEMDAADRKVRIWADVTNSGNIRLLAGETVTLVIPPPESK